MVILVSSSSSLSLLSSAVNDMYSSSESDVGMVSLVLLGSGDGVLVEVEVLYD